MDVKVTAAVAARDWLTADLHVAALPLAFRWASVKKGGDATATRSTDDRPPCQNFSVEEFTTPLQ